MQKNRKGERTETARGGEGAKAPGSHPTLRGSDTVAIPTLTQFLSATEPDPIPPPSDLTPPVEEVEVEYDRPMIDDLPVVPRNFKINQLRSFSTKNVGLDASGKVIPHFRSEEVAQVVAHWASVGAPEAFMCAMLNIRPGLLKKHYYNELTHGLTLANTMVAGKAFEMAMSGDSDSMTKFWLKSRAKWKDGENAGAQDLPLLNIHIHAE